MKITFTLNDQPKTLNDQPGDSVRTLLQREGIFSLRDGCDGQGSCGSCSIILEGKTVNSCLLLPGQIDGKQVWTVEFLTKNQKISEIQSAMIEAGIVQCGYCSPAMVLAIRDLLDRVPNPTEEEIKDGLSGIFCRCTGYQQIFKAVSIAAGRKSDPGYTEEVAPEFREDLKHVGKNRGKVDGVQLVKGERAFVEDMVNKESCYLKILRSPHAHSYITNIDISEAEKIPGVVYILTHKNCPNIYYNQAGQGFPEPSPYDRKMFGQKVLHVGDRVAAVVAESLEIAEKAIREIRVDYELLEPVLSINEASKPNAPILHNSIIEYKSGEPDDLDNSHTDKRDGKIIYQFPIGANPHKNIAASVDGGIGDIELGFKEADIRLEREFQTTQVQCTPLEPHVCYTKMEGERLIIHASTQVPWHLRRIVAYVLGISENKIRVIKERVGGGFGSKQDIVMDEVCAYLTYLTGRSIYFRFTREEEFIASRTRHPMKIKVKLGAKKDGKLTAMQMDVLANTGPYGSHSLTVPMNACSKSLSLLLCDNITFSVKTYYSNIPPTGAYQGYGAPKGSFAIQTAMAELAEKLDMDPLELLEINRVREGDKLEILRCLGEGREGKAVRIQSCGLGSALKRGKELIQWGKKEISDQPDTFIGKAGVIVQQGSGLPGLDASNATIKMLGDGTFMVFTGGADIGTGLDTLAVKIAAEALHTDIDMISIISGDTDITPFDTGAYASSGTFFSGNAVLKCAEKMMETIFLTAANILNENPEDLKVISPSRIKGKKSEITYSEIAHHTQSGEGVGQLICSAGYTTEDAAFPYGAHFCQVEVNRRTGELKVQKYYALQDCGTPINPELAQGQMYGGVLKSIGHSLWEEMILDRTGRCLNPNLLDYKVPMIKDIPEDFRAELVYTKDPYGPYGGKSIAEISTNGAAAVLAIAIHDAIGVWLRKWPFSPESILKVLGKI